MSSMLQAELLAQARRLATERHQLEAGKRQIEGRVHALMGKEWDLVEV